MASWAEIRTLCRPFLLLIICSTISKRGEGVGRFGDKLCDDFANVPYVRVRNKFTNTKFQQT